ncbi:MAG: hypothetical protein K8S62_13515 [Candidatus Sabulitectum sp.]|nr:hypothetical protein [Candidatus Sabulitectum sp.]
MFWKIVLRGNNPSGRILAVLCARTAETIDSVREMLDSPDGLVLQTGLSRERAQALSLELPHDGSVQIHTRPDEEACMPVLMGYRPGSRGRLRVALQKLSRLPTEEVIRFLASIPIVLKPDADRATAESIKRILERAGGIVDIRSPEDLVGVSSRKHYSPSLLEEASDKKTVSGFSSMNMEPVSSVTHNSPPHAVLDAGSRTGRQNDTKPGRIDFLPPPLSRIATPPVVKEDTVEESVSSLPYIIRFTVPAASIPAAIPAEQMNFIPPEQRQSARIVLIYLFPVAPEEEERVQNVLCESLDISPEKASRLIGNAPVALTGFSERIDALVAMSELADHGIPISLVPGYSSNTDPAPGRSLFGWLNEHGRTS